MYGDSNVLNTVAPVATTATVATLPSTGSNDTLLTIALAVAAGLATWAAIYFLQARASK
jgi:LPXTG-motif cell wall-anchored protein